MVCLNLSLSDILGFISIILGIISIIISFIIYRLSNRTSKQLAEEAAQKVFNKEYNVPDKIIKEHKIIYENIDVKKMKKRVRQIIKLSKKNSRKEPWVYATLFQIKLSDITNDKDIIVFMYIWKSMNYINWEGALENSTKIFIKKEKEIYEYFNTC